MEKTSGIEPFGPGVGGGRAAAGGALPRFPGVPSGDSSLFRDGVSDGPLGEAEALHNPYYRTFLNLEQIFSQIIHDGRNHLSPIKGYASLIENGTAPGSEEHRWARKIIKNIMCMERYYDVLSLCRIKGITEVSEVEWKELIGGVLDSFFYMNKRNIPLRVFDGVRGSIVTRVELLKRVLLHILRNAYESVGDRGTVTISTDLRRGPDRARPGGDRVQVIVLDTGSGIFESDMAHIWKPFFSTKPGHFGLGLSYVGMAASMLDMKCDVTSAPGNGTTFSMTFKPEGGRLEIPQTAYRG